MSLQCRHLNEDEKPALLAEFADFDLQPGWCWLCENEERQVVGAMLGGRLHGMFVLLRLIVAPDAPKATALTLLRYGFHQAKVRGLKGYMTLLEPQRGIEYKLGKLLQRCSAQFFPLQHPTLLVAGTLQSRFIR